MDPLTAVVLLLAPVVGLGGLMVLGAIERHLPGEAGPPPEGPEPGGSREPG